MVRTCQSEACSEGYNNTKYTHLIANAKHHKQIFQLEQYESTIAGQEHLKAHFTNLCFLSLQFNVRFETFPGIPPHIMTRLNRSESKRHTCRGS